jgi:hypothetical protein
MVIKPTVNLKRKEPLGFIAVLPLFLQVGIPFEFYYGISHQVGKEGGVGDLLSNSCI